LLRSSGIPARVAAGFAQGELDATLNAYRVLESDAHSWVEVYFPGYGWIEFEPTSSIQPINRPASYPKGTQSGSPLVEEQFFEPTPASSELMPGTMEDINAQDSQNANSAGLPAQVITALMVVGGILMTGFFVTLAGVGAWYWLEQRGMARLSEISRSYARLNTYAQLLRMPVDESATPYERAAQLVKNLPEGKKPISTIVNLYVAEQYGPPSSELFQPTHRSVEAREAWTAARSILFKRMVRRPIRDWGLGVTTSGRGD
jgi:hypothetical protein